MLNYPSSFERSGSDLSPSPPVASPPVLCASALLAWECQSTRKRTNAYLSKEG